MEKPLWAWDMEAAAEAVRAFSEELAEVLDAATEVARKAFRELERALGLANREPPGTGRARRHQPRGPRCLGRAVRGHAPRPRPVARSDKLTRREQSCRHRQSELAR